MRKEQEEIVAMRPVKLVTEYGRIDPGILEEMLRRHEIPYYTEKKGSGLYLDICFGYSSDGVDFYVDESDLERAREVAEVLEEGAELPEDEPEESGEETEESDTGESSSFFTRERIKIMILLAILALLIPRLIFYIGSNPFQ